MTDPGDANRRADLPHCASACGRILVSRRPAAAVAVARPAGGIHARPGSGGVTLRPEWVINGNYHPSSGYEMFAALCARLGRPPKALFTAACGLLEGVLRYMSQHHLLDSNIHLASFDDHYLYDSLSLRIDTVQQDNRQLAWHCYDLLSQLIDGQAPEPLQRYLPATLQFRHP